MSDPLDILDDGRPDYPARRNDPPAPKPKRAKARKKVVRRAAKPHKSEDDRPIFNGAGDLAGISATQCPAGCTATHCVISTVDICKHPNKTGDAGCGPVTVRNRERARKLIKHQLIDLRG